LPDTPKGPTPATGSASPGETDIEPEEEPIVPGTFFLTMALMLLIIGAWIVVFWMLLNR